MFEHDEISRERRAVMQPDPGLCDGRIRIKLTLLVVNHLTVVVVHVEQMLVEHEVILDLFDFSSTEPD
jgi:hypothetical protein